MDNLLFLCGRNSQQLIQWAKAHQTCEQEHNGEYPKNNRGQPTYNVVKIKYRDYSHQNQSNDFVNGAHVLFHTFLLESKKVLYPPDKFLT